MIFPENKRYNRFGFLNYLLSITIIIIIILCILKWHFNISVLGKYLTSNDDNIYSSDGNQLISNDQFVSVYLSSSINGPKLRGQIIEEENIKLAQFLGIRYAEIPKRFRKAKPIGTWTGTKDALDWPPLCMQNKLDQYDYLTKIYNYNISEDCLYLNIWSPLDNVKENNNRENRMKGKFLLPVIIFIHGGSFSYMGISMEAYYGGIVSAIGNVVFVTINYRVGLFGFFDNDLEQNEFNVNNMPLEYDKNIGLYDQITAIKWVRKNIHHFGGDPNRITLQGQSAGAISIGLLMISPLSRNLFQRAILQSASPMMFKQIFTSTHYSKVVQLANCSIGSSLKDKRKKYMDEDLIDSNDDYEDDDDYYYDIQQRINETNCIEQLSAMKVNQIQDEMLKENTISFSPSIPSILLPEFAEDQSENILQKEILIGANANESTLFLHQEFPQLIPLTRDLNVPLDNLIKIIDKLDNNSTNVKKFTSFIVEQMKSHNIIEEKEIVKHLIIFLSDFMFKGPVFKFAKLLSQNSDNNVYLYLFNERTSIFPTWIGSAHWNEMDFVFGIPLLHPEDFTKQQRELSVRMIKTWTHFATTGKMLPQNRVEWPRLDDKNIHMNLMSNNVSIGHNLDMMFYYFFELVYDLT